jgi:hypothetical protein
MATPGQIQEVARHFLIAAIWADAPEGTRPRAPAATEARAFNICKAFIDANNELFNHAMECAAEGYGSHPDAGSAEASFGHDLWLTTQGHGTGFWDREELPDDLGAALTKACEEFRGVYPEFYRGWLYLNGEAVHGVNERVAAMNRHQQ